MTTFDLAEVRNFAADLDAQMDRCDNGEGLECATLDATLCHYADVCIEFLMEVTKWGLEVFAGRVAFDPAVEQLLKSEGWKLYDRARELLPSRQQTEDCYILDGHKTLEWAIGLLYQLLNNWVTPKLAVGPAARLGLPLEPAAAEEVRRRINSLPPLPADWQPDEPRQQKQYRKLRKS